jgi:hypothetical protein
VRSRLAAAGTEGSSAQVVRPPIARASSSRALACAMLRFCSCARAISASSSGSPKLFQTSLAAGAAASSTAPRASAKPTGSGVAGGW